MKNSVKTKLTSAKNHVVRNRGRYGFVAGLIAGSYVTGVAVRTGEILEELSDDLMDHIETTV